MNPCIEYKDTVTFYVTQPDEYGADVAVSQHDVEAVIEMNTGFAHASYQDAILSDAIVYVNPENEFVQDNYYRLEELLVKLAPFGGTVADNLYKVTSVSVARDSQLCNEVDNVELLLKKTSGDISNVS